MPWGLLGMLALVAAVEMFVAARPLDYSDPVAMSWRLAAIAARDEAPGCRVLCVGDSLVKHAVIPAVVEAGTGRRVVNLSVAQGSAPATFFLLRRALEAGARPDAVVVDFKPGVLFNAPRQNLRYWQEVLTPRECLELARDARSGSLLTELALGRVLPTIRGRLQVRGHILASLRGEPSPLRLFNRTCRRNWLVNAGANVAARNPAFTGAPNPGEKPPYFHRWRCDRVNARYVRRVFDLAAARGIRVFWLLPPSSPWLQIVREASGAEAGYVGYVRSLQARYPNLTIVDGRHSGYDATVFIDTTHLDGRGAAVLSADLAEILACDRDVSMQGWWIKLPRYRPRPAEVAIEDVEQSRRVVQSSRLSETSVR